MNFRTVDEFENFDFNEAHIGGIEVKSGHVFLYLDNVMISAKNSCNRDIREMRTNELVLKLQDGQITSFVKEGVKVYNADGVFQREIPDEIIPAEKYEETFEMLFDKYMLEAGIKKNDETATKNKKESIISTRKDNLYTETTDKWLEDADITVDKKVLKTLKIKDNHKYTIATATPEATEEATETPEAAEAAKTTEAADATETPEATEAADATETPEATEEATAYSTDTSLTVKDGDTVNIDYVGKIDGTAFDGGSTNGKGTDLEIGSGSYIDDFEDQLVGAHPGDKVEVTVTFPDEYPASPDLAGKEAVFDVTVNGIYE